MPPRSDRSSTDRSLAEQTITNLKIEPEEELEGGERREKGKGRGRDRRRGREREREREGVREKGIWTGEIEGGS